MGKNDSLIVKAGDYNEKISKAAQKLGLNVTAFLRMAGIEKANSILEGENK